MALRDPCAPSSKIAGYGAWSAIGTISGHLLGFPSCWQRQWLDHCKARSSGAPQ